MSQGCSLKSGQLPQVVSAIILIKRMAKGGQIAPFLFEALWREAATEEDEATAAAQRPEGGVAPPALATRRGLDRAHVTSKLQDIVRSLFGLEVPSSQPLMEAGLDSLSAAELQNAVATAFSADLPATVMFDYPTLEALANYVTEQVSAKATAGTMHD